MALLLIIILQLSYYDTQSDIKSKGTIDMSEVITIQVLMNPPGNHSNIIEAFSRLISPRSISDTCSQGW